MSADAAGVGAPETGSGLTEASFGQLGSASHNSCSGYNTSISKIQKSLQLCLNK